MMGAHSIRGRANIVITKKPMRAVPYGMSSFRKHLVLAVRPWLFHRVTGSINPATKHVAGLITTQTRRSTS